MDTTPLLVGDVGVPPPCIVSKSSEVDSIIGPWRIADDKLSDLRANLSDDMRVYHRKDGVCTVYITEFL